MISQTIEKYCKTIDFNTASQAQVHMIELLEISLYFVLYGLQLDAIIHAIVISNDIRFWRTITAVCGLILN